LTGRGLSASVLAEASMRSLFLAPLAALPLVSLSIPSLAIPSLAIPSPAIPSRAILAAPARGTAPCANNLMQEPVLVYDLTGYTLIGFLHRHLAVYNNGVASISAVSTNTLTEAPDWNKAAVAFVSPDEADKLLRELSNDGAFGLCDQSIIVLDMPMTTVTVSRGATDAQSHTFSYWFGDGSYGKVQQTIDAFIQKTFPNF
jgi:hypothetical protein